MFADIDERSIATCMFCMLLSKSSEITSCAFFSLGYVTDSVLSPLLRITMNELNKVLAQKLPISEVPDGSKRLKATLSKFPYLQNRLKEHIAGDIFRAVHTVSKLAASKTLHYSPSPPPKH
ncbi:hypothetical protein AVEN_34810-1 [Araneus ventricosus]|uniref:Uncharacterized protein n=1 Tax=Araneus ventricosus TaxID=182803 RepID=A0A4Y2N5B8_ARAVE|nr:hypothetical protein AVEN_34810-1 [Araneus ventricosus]